MKKPLFLIILIASVFFISPVHSVAAQENSPIEITQQFKITAVKNTNPDKNKDYTVKVIGTIKNNSAETISNIKIYLEVSTAFLGLDKTLIITIDDKLLPSQSRIINVTEDLSEKFTKIDRVFATVDGGERFDLVTGNKDDVEYKPPNIWVSVTLLAVFAGLFVIAVTINKKKNKNTKKI